MIYIWLIIILVAISIINYFLKKRTEKYKYISPSNNKRIYSLGIISKITQIIEFIAILIWVIIFLYLYVVK